MSAGRGPNRVLAQRPRDTDLGPFADLHDSERFVANIHRAYSELRGEPRGAAIPLGSVMPDMIAYNGGKVPECLA